MSNSPWPSTAGATHDDHQPCTDRCLALADRVCEARHARLTPQRRRVLAAVADRRTAVGAYEIMDLLAVDGRRPAPVSVYRALEFLVEQGLIHRLSSLNAFIACAEPTASHRAQFLICRGCRIIVELRSQAVEEAVEADAAARDFTVSSAVVEVSGLCHTCRQS